MESDALRAASFSGGSGSRKELFQTNANAPQGEMRVSSERRKAQIEIVRRAFIEWQDAVDRYLAALKS
jgi:hypothetical protein